MRVLAQACVPSRPFRFPGRRRDRPAEDLVARTTAEMVAETRRFQQERADLAAVRRAVERMPDDTRAMLQHHISAWRDGQHDWWTRYLLEDLAVVANRDDRWPAA
ncbi:MAG: hypothetical protein K0R41_2730 [Geminicoccaceae bacterium]|nr:hypothetical protein [Geminicoccaceae bacterium]